MLGHAAHVGPWAHTGPCRAMLAHVAHPDPCWPILTHVGPCSPMLPHVGPCWPMLPHVGPCWPMLAQQPDGQLPANATAVAAPQACQTRVKMHAPSTQPSKLMFLYGFAPKQPFRCGVMTNIHKKARNQHVFTVICDTVKPATTKHSVFTMIFAC
jgi:hypothetical protein